MKTRVCLKHFVHDFSLVCIHLHLPHLLYRYMFDNLLFPALHGRFWYSKFLIWDKYCVWQIIVLAVCVTSICFGSKKVSLCGNTFVRSIGSNLITRICQFLGLTSNDFLHNTIQCYCLVIDFISKLKTQLSNLPINVFFCKYRYCMTR